MVEIKLVHPGLVQNHLSKYEPVADLQLSWPGKLRQQRIYNMALKNTIGFSLHV